jgi:signal peptidase I
MLWVFLGACQQSPQAPVLTSNPSSAQAPLERDEPARPEEASLIPSNPNIRTIRGHSLRGLLEDGDAITVDEGYFDRHAPQHEDIAIVRWAGHKIPVAKVVRGVAGDRFALRPDNGVWSIEVNGVPLKTTSGEAYALSERASRLLRVYEADYKGVIPANAVLLLGNAPGGSMDATTFGLLDRSNLIGKVRMDGEPGGTNDG